MAVKANPVRFMHYTYKHLLPAVHENLDYWRYKANLIPNTELRKQALDSIRTKTFHCEGGSVFGYLVKENKDSFVRFVVAFQTISDYLDNLCDRSTSLDPKDFAMLHQAMQDALTPNGELHDYYAFRDEKNDGGYLAELVKECQTVLRELPSYEKVQPTVLELNSLYNNLQTWKHIHVLEREEQLLSWFSKEKHRILHAPMEWYEFAAATGSTLGIFVLVAYAHREDLREEQINNINRLYFPFVHGIHILLDYFIDMDEDEAGGDLNFCSYYEKLSHVYKTLEGFYIQAKEIFPKVEDKKFHRMVIDSMLGLYLSDSKVKASSKIDRQLTIKIRRLGGFHSWFFYWNAKIYRGLQGNS